MPESNDPPELAAFVVPCCSHKNTGVRAVLAFWVSSTAHSLTASPRFGPSAWPEHQSGGFGWIVLLKPGTLIRLAGIGDLARTTVGRADAISDDVRPITPARFDTTASLSSLCEDVIALIASTTRRTDSDHVGK